MHPIKICWGIRALLNSFFFKKIGLPTYMAKPCFIEGRRRITIGKHVRIFPGIRLEALGTGEIVIGNNVAIEQNVQIAAKDSVVSIGDNVTIAANVFISNIDHDYRDIDKGVMDQEDIVSITTIDSECFIGNGVKILAGTRLGKHCIVGSNAVLRGEFPDYSVIVGAPARVVKKYNFDSEMWEKI